MATHTDGENRGLMDLIADCGAHVAESITPHPMTKVTVEEYYRRWAPRMALMGCIPECIMLRETASDDEFEGFLDGLFRAVAPGDRIIFGIADSTPPGAVFERLQRIGERVEKQGRLPLEAGGARPLGADQMAAAAARTAPKGERDPDYRRIQKDVLGGDAEALKARVLALLDRGVDAGAILKRGMIAAMEELGEQFKAGEVFLPEMLLAARAMNAALELLEPHLRGDERERGAKVVIGTVKGDLHDIGKNVVSIMLRGVGFQVRDIGVNVETEEFVRQVKEFGPQILALSALLTTTMPEMKRVIDALEEGKLRGDLKVLVGGAPVNQSYADEIRADAYAPDASEAVEVAKSLTQ
jgi:5-methyltetrahydrofolate--homocysteine methyltransferase